MVALVGFVLITLAFAHLSDLTAGDGDQDIAVICLLLSVLFAFATAVQLFWMVGTGRFL